MSDLIIGLVFGFILGFCACVYFASDAMGLGFNGQKLIEQCEKNLTRDKHCVIAAVEESK